MSDDETNEELEVWQFSPENLHTVLDKMKMTSPLLADMPTEEIVEEYLKLFSEKNEDGMMEISVWHLNQIVSRVINDTLEALTRKGLVDAQVRDDGEFVFQITEKGREEYRKRNGPLSSESDEDEENTDEKTS